MKLLVVDDDPEIRHVARYALEKAGYAVATAATASEGLERAREERPDAIVVDVVLPDDGISLIERLREEPALVDVPIVCLTGKTDPQRVEALKETGVAGILPKPFDPLALADEVSRLVGGPDA